jgi:hypothetical protein
LQSEHGGIHLSSYLFKKDGEFEASPAKLAIHYLKNKRSGA